MKSNVRIFIYHDTKANNVLLVNHDEQNYLVTSAPSVIEAFRSKEKELNIHYVTAHSADRIINFCDVHNYRKI